MGRSTSGRHATCRIRGCCQRKYRPVRLCCWPVLWIYPIHCQRFRSCGLAFRESTDGSNLYPLASGKRVRHQARIWSATERCNMYWTLSSRETPMWQITYSRSRRMLLLAAIVVLAFACRCLKSDAAQCERVWAAEVPSPDRRWIADVHQDVCDAGLGSAAQELVDVVSKRNPKRRTTVLTPTGQWTNPAEVRATWLSPTTLQISVPNRTRFNLRKLQYDGVDVRVQYRNDNPTDRANWLHWVRQHLKWVSNGLVGPEPKPPPLPK